ncbi:MAG: DUF4956 domain-containing protein [candidate division WOR-3 bacterium]
MEALKRITEDLGQIGTIGPTIVAKLAIAFICGFFVAWLYRKTYRGPGYSVAYTNTLIILCMTTAVRISVIGNNLARAFGLVGALSVVRFRHAVKNTQDIVYVFFSLAIGMAAGVGFYTIALVGTATIGLTIFLLSKARFSAPRRDDYLLQLNVRSSTHPTPPYLGVLNRHCAKLTPINVRTLGETDQIELSYYVRLKQKGHGAELIQELNRTPNVQFVNLFFDEEQI